MKIAVFTGGESFEREVAFWSAKNVVAELEGAGFEVVKFDVPSELPKFLETKDQFSCVVPVLHGKGGEDGEIQGFLKTLKVPFIFSDVIAHAVGIDKSLAKDVVSRHGLKTPNAKRVCKEDRDQVSFAHAVVVKPVDGGSSLGTSIVREEDYLQKALDQAFEQSHTVLVEDYVAGNEFTVPVIDDGGKTIALSVTQIVPVVEGGFYDFEAKYGSETPAEHLLPAPISSELTKKLQEQAVIAHDAIGARHVSRVDFVVGEDGEPAFYEINTIPGCTDSSLLPESIRHSGRDFGRLLKQWIESVV